MKVVREKYVRPNENTFLKRHAFPNHVSIFDGAAVADYGAGFDKGMIADIAFLSDLHVVHHM